MYMHLEPIPLYSFLNTRRTWNVKVAASCYFNLESRKKYVSILMTYICGSWTLFHRFL